MLPTTIVDLSSMIGVSLTLSDPPLSTPGTLVTIGPMARYPRPGPGSHLNDNIP